MNKERSMLRCCTYAVVAFCWSMHISWSNGLLMILRILLTMTDSAGFPFVFLANSSEIILMGSDR